MFIGVIVDLHERDQARFWFDEFFDLSLELLAIASLEGEFTRLNPAGETTLGHPVAELLARPFLDLIHPDDVEVTWAAIGTLVETGRVSAFENRCRAADGSYHWLEWSARMAHDDRIMAVAHDVTRRHDTEELQRVASEEADRANRAKSDFLSRMSHELRTPLNSVIGFAQLLGMDDLTDHQREHVRFIQQSGHYLLDLINEVLDITQVESGHLRISLEPVDVGETLCVALDLVAPQAAEYEVSLPDHIDTEGLYVLADRQRLLQILLNLLSNALKYNRRGGSITITCDTGIGISEANLAKLFTPFDRIGAEYTDIEGSGVGLALSLALSREMGGSLTASSVLDDGSTFCLELPQAQPDGATTADTQGSAPISGVGPTDRTLTVLCIEDNASNSLLLERALETQPNVEAVTAIQGSMGL